MDTNSNTMEGGYLEGNSHANGGIKIKTPEGQIEAEGGETIINKRSMESQDILICEGTPKEIASKVNEYGGGVEFAEGGNCKTVSIAEDGTQVESNMPKEDTTTFDNGGAVQEEISTKPETIETKEAKETTYTITSLYDSELSWQSSYKGIEDYIKVEGGQFDCQKDDTMAVCLRKLGLRMVANIEIPIYETDFDIHDDQTASRGTNLRSTDKDKRPSPSISATIFLVGYTMEGNDGNMWKINEDSRGIHRWGRVKAEDGLDITMDNEDISRLEKLKKEGKLKRYLDVRGNGKKVFETIIPNKSEKGMYKRYESTSQTSLGTLQNEYLDENDVLNWLKKTSPKYNKSSTVEGEENFYNINGIIKTKSGIVLNVGDDVLLHNMYEVKVKSINTDTNSVIVKYPDGKELLWGTTNIYVKKYAKGSTIGGVDYFKSGYTLKGRKGKYWIDDVEGRVTKDSYFENYEDAVAEIDLLSKFKKQKNEQRVKGPSMENLMEADRYYTNGGGVEEYGIKYDELIELKKQLKDLFIRVANQYRNKHKDGSGNFGYFMRTLDEKKIYELHGKYMPDGTIRAMILSSDNLSKRYPVKYKTIDDLIKSIRDAVEERGKYGIGGFLAGVGLGVAGKYFYDKNKGEIGKNKKFNNGGGVGKENADNVLLEMNESINNFEEKWLWYLKNDNLLVEFNLHYGWVDEEYYVGPEERMGEFLKALDYRYVALEDEDSNVVMVSKEKEKEIIKELDNIFKEYFENKDKDIEIDNVIYGERKYIYDGPIILENSKGIPEYEKGNIIKGGYSKYRVEGGDMDLSLKDKIAMYSWIDNFFEKYSGDDNFSQSLDIYNEFSKKFGKNKEQTHDIIDSGWARSRGYYEKSQAIKKNANKYEKGNTIKDEMTFNNSIGNAITRLTNYIATHENKIVINKSTYTIEKVTPNFIRVSGGQGATYNIVPYFPKNALNTPSPLLVPRSYYSLSRGSVKHTFAILEDGSLFDIAEEGIDVNINEPKMNSFKSTFTINNNYKGKRPFEIWDAWNEDQRKHFLKDHDIKNLDNSKIKEYTFDELPLSVKIAVRFHKNSGQYVNGGIIGKRIKIIKMNDPYPVEPGTMGTVKFIDDNGQIHVNWDNGRTLAIIPRVDEYQIM